MRAALLSLASPASAQNLIHNAKWVARSGDPVPDTLGVPFPNFIFGAASVFDHFGRSVQNDTGIFAAQLVAGVHVINLVAREGQAAPGTAGCTMGTVNPFDLAQHDDGSIFCSLQLRGGDVTGTDNDESSERAHRRIGLRVYRWQPERSGAPEKPGKK